MYVYKFYHKLVHHKLIKFLEVFQAQNRFYYFVSNLYYRHWIVTLKVCLNWLIGFRNSKKKKLVRNCTQQVYFKLCTAACEQSFSTTCFLLDSLSIYLFFSKIMKFTCPKREALHLSNLQLLSTFHKNWNTKTLVVQPSVQSFFLFWQDIWGFPMSSGDSLKKSFAVECRKGTNKALKLMLFR